MAVIVNSGNTYKALNMMLMSYKRFRCTCGAWVTSRMHKCWYCGRIVKEKPYG